jgi:hypothetical protein
MRLTAANREIDVSSTTLSELLGYGGVLANLCWPLMRKRHLLLAGQVVACLLMLGHFLLMQAFTGAAIMAVAGVQAALAIPLGTHPRFKVVYLLALVLTPLVCWATWQGPQSIFSSLALLIVCVANFQLNTLCQRLGLIMAIFAWYAHNAMVGSVPGLVSNTLALCVSVAMCIRLYRQERASRST